MIYKQYFPYFQQTIKRNYFGRYEVEAPEGKTGNKKVTDEEKSVDTMQNTKEIQKVEKQEVEKQVDSETSGAESKTDESGDLPGFEQVGPGLFQFKSPKWTTPAAQPLCGQPQKQELQQQVYYNPPPASEGFARVNGIPGAYQNFPTAVYQFT